MKEKNFAAKTLSKIKPIADKVVELEDRYSKMSDSELSNMTNVFKSLIQNGATLDVILPDAFATVREVAYRLLGKKPYYVQILGGIALHKGFIAEQKTGEGKTLTETMPVYLNALEGKGVHVVTVNDYLAKRDSEEMGKIYKFLGLTVGLISSEIKDVYRKKKAYNCDITYGTNNEFGFDYLRDNIAKDKNFLVQRGHNFAIVDEVDSILIDEARTPLIISGNGDDNTDFYKTIADLVRTMTSISVIETESGELNYENNEADYIIHEKNKHVTLTPHGIMKAEAYLHVKNITSPENALLYHVLNQAIKAAGVMIKNRDYVVKNDEVLIVDEFTGRIMKGRQFNEGLHQAIQAKENVKITNESQTVASVTFQNYFRMYAKLSGMTGTAMTEQEEFKDIYDLKVIPIPTNKPTRRIDHNDIVYFTEDEKYEAIVNKILECHKRGQPVLVGTSSVEKSELVAKKIKEKSSIKFNVLNAKNDELEASIIAQAGRMGAVTISTNMAGRGTDIFLGGNPEFITKDTLKKENYYSNIIKKHTGIMSKTPESESVWNALEAEMIDNVDTLRKTNNPMILEARRRYNSLLNAYKMICDSEKEAVQKRGGLFVIGCERHESRRIDNQLIGRAGRQGDCGESQFYISFEDDLMKLFADDKFVSLFKNKKEKEVIQDQLLEKVITSAQKKIEGQHFEQRKNVFDYDIIMNEQRVSMYKERKAILDAENVEVICLNVIQKSLSENLNFYFSDKKFSFEKFKNIYGDDVCCFISENGINHCENAKNIIHELFNYILRFMNDIKTELGEEAYLKALKDLLLETIDLHWVRHLNNIELLKKGIYLMGYGQKDPKVEFKFSAYKIYDEMLQNIRSNYLKQIFFLKKI